MGPARTCNDIVRETTQMRGWGRFLTDEAEDSKQPGGTIYFWIHETGEYEPIAGSLDPA